MCQDMDTMPRTKTPVATSYDPELLARLDAWLAKQEFPPKKVDVFEVSLREFLDKREKAKK